MNTSDQSIHGLRISLSGGRVEAGDDVDHHETGSSRLWVINPNRFTVDPMEFERLDNVEHHTWERPLSWTVLIQDKASGHFRAATSVHAEFPWYYAPDHPGVLSTDLQYVARATGLNQPDPVSLCSYLANSWSVGGFSLVDGIRKAWGGHLIDVTDSGFSETPVDLRNWLGLDDSISDPNLLVKLFTEACEEGLHDQDSQVTLTSGKDSRAILAAVLTTGRQFVLQTGVSARLSAKDIDVPKKIAQMISAEHLIVDAKDVEIPSADHVFRSFAANNNGESDPLNAIIHYKEFVRGDHRPSKLGGWSGEIYYGLPRTYMNVLDLKLRDFDRATVEQVQQRMQVRYDDMQELSERYAVDLFHLREKTMHAVSSVLRTYLPYFNTYAPFLDPRLMQLGYRFAGGPQQSRLHQTLFATMPEGIQEMNVNPGGNLGVWLFKAKRRFFPEINRSLLAEPDHLRQKIDPSLFTGIVTEEAIDEKLGSFAKGKVRSAGALHKMLGLQYFFELLDE